jgi:hypothetical protein
MGADAETRWIVTARRYYLINSIGGEWFDGLAEKVRAERRDIVAWSWSRVLETVYWWPEHEGPEWPALVIPAPEWVGVGPEPDAWAHFEEVVRLTGRCRWEQLPERKLPKA